MTDRCFLIVFGFLFILVVSGCNHSGQRREPDERQIIADYGSYPFTDWIDWSVSYREGAGYYLACYEHGDTFDKILFFKKDSIVVVAPSVEGSHKNSYYSLNDLKISGVWDQCYPEADYAVFCQLAYFITNTGLQLVQVTEYDVRLEGKNFIILKRIRPDGFINDAYFCPMGNGWYLYSKKTSKSKEQRENGDHLLLVSTRRHCGLAHDVVAAVFGVKMPEIATRRQCRSLSMSSRQKKAGCGHRMEIQPHFSFCGNTLQARIRRPKGDYLLIV